MKTGKLLRAARFGVLVTFVAALTVWAQTSVRYTSQPGSSSVRIDGEATRSTWSVEGQLIGGFIELPEGFLTDPAQPIPAEATSTKISPKLEVFIAVRSLRSGNRVMDSTMQGALKMKEHPRIEYRLKEMVLKETPASAEAPLKFDSKGDLTVAGVTKPIEMEIVMERLDDGKLAFKGDTPLKMTDFDVAPPVFGIAPLRLTTSDDIKVTFKWVTGRR